MRNAFMDELIKAARVRNDIVLIIGDLGYSVIEPFADEFPDRFFNAGIAEQNMMGMAAGMASEGMQVFTYSIGNFPTWRCAEQIRNDVDYHNLPVTNVVVGGGVTYGSLGYSHHAIQDYALMRSLLNMTIAAPADPHETRLCMQYALGKKKPVYLRLQKAGEKKYTHHNGPLSDCEVYLIHDNANSKEIFVTTGPTLSKAMDLIKTNPFKNYSVATIPLWNSQNRRNILGTLLQYTSITTIEDHLLDGGFASWLLETLSKESDFNKISLSAMCIGADVIGRTASQKKLHEISGI